MEFQKEAGRIFLETKGEVLAELTYPLQGDIPCIDHTYVSDQLRGQGIAGQLVEACLNDLQKKQQSFRVTCSYASKWLSVHYPDHPLWIK